MKRMIRLVAIKLSILLIVITIVPVSQAASVRGTLRGKLFGEKVFSKINVNSNDAFILGTASSGGVIDWKTILAVSSVSGVSPILVVENKNGIDDFSSKLFLDQYKPKRIWTNNYELNSSPTIKIVENVNALLYKSANFVVIADGDDYDQSISAASFAAYYTIPLFFSPLNDDENSLIKRWGARTISIGTSKNTDYTLTIDEALDLVKKKSDYLILTTSDDLSAPSRQRFSLVAPILAGGRNGVVLNIKNPTRESVKERINFETQNGFRPSYIVVVGSEKNFPFLQFDRVPLNTYYNQDDEYQYFVNLYYWANFDPSNEYYDDAVTGAMTGYSVSDISALTARSLFYKRIARSDKVVTWSPYSSWNPEERNNASIIEPVLDSVFAKKYINNYVDFTLLTNKDTVIKEIEDASIFIYNGHSSRTGLGNLPMSEMPVFKNPVFIFALGCAALEPWNQQAFGLAPEGQDNSAERLITYEAIRNGAVGVFGHAEISIDVRNLYFGSETRNFIETALKGTVGDSLFLTKHLADAELLYLGKKVPDREKSYTYILGDPKLKIKAHSTLSPILTSSDAIRLDIDGKSVIEKFARYIPSGGATLCRIYTKDCEDILKANGQQFYFPVLLDSFIFSVDGGNFMNDAVLFRMFLRFLTSYEARSIDIVPNENYNPVMQPIKQSGGYCFTLGKKRFCPNFVTFEYGKFISPEAQTTSIDIPSYIDIRLRR